MTVPAWFIFSCSLPASPRCRKRRGLQRVLVAQLPSTFLLTLLVFLSLALRASSSLATDCAALQSFYAATNGTNWVRSDGWTQEPGTTSCCSWYGITCTQSRVYDISLRGNRLSGSLAPELSALSELRALDLSNMPGDDRSNHILGTLPEAWSSMPNIRVINLGNNDLTGTLPPQWGNLSTLVEFVVAANLLVGSLPPQWSEMKDLSTFVAMQNNLIGTLPPEWGAHDAMQEFAVSSNTLEGTLPVEYSQWTFLQVFDVFQNKLTGTLPPQYAAWGSLSRMYLQINGFSGSLPPEWSQLSEMEVFLFHVNNISGSLPPEYASWTKVRTFYGYSCHLNGVLPHEWSTWSSISQISLQYNKLSGSLPSQWSSWASLTSFDIESNAISGQIPSEWTALISLRDLYIADNAISGTLESAWTAWSSLESFYAQGNPFSGTLPTEWASWRELNGLALKSVELSGPLPSEWSAWTKMDAFFLSHTSVWGTLPPEWSAWNASSVALMHNAYLNGSLPREWSAWPIEGFYLEGSQVTGSVPTEWSAWSELGMFSVIGNRLEGVFGLCAHSLQTIILDDNQFEGIADCVHDGSVVSLSLDRNPIHKFPLSSDSSTSITVLDLRNCGLNMHITELPIGPHVVPVLLLSDNLGIWGDLMGLVELGVVSSYVEIDLSNTSVSGRLTSLSPQTVGLYLFENFPLSNIIEFSVASNVWIEGPLPVEWFSWVGSRGRILSLNVTDVPKLQAADAADIPASCERIASTPSLGLPFDCAASPVVYTDASYLCQPLAWPVGVRVLGLHATYFHYRTCECAPGLEGTPPSCRFVSHHGEVVGLSVGFSVLVAVFAVLAAGKIVRWRRLVADMRRAQEMLREYGYGRDGAAGMETPLLATRAISEDWVIPYDELRIVKTIASGAQGQVSMALWNRTVVAVKEFFLRSEDERESLLGEAAMHIQLRHPNVVQLLGVCLEPACVIIEWMERGSLFDVMQSDPHSLPDIRRIALDIARGVLYLHSKGVIHRDLKSLNVMLDSRYTAKVGDFGNARQRSAESTMTVGLGTMHWMAPEVFASGHYSEKCDVYSFGMLLWELLTFEVPFPEFSFSYQVMEAVRSGCRPDVQRIPDVEGHVPLIDLMTRCWAADPDERPGFDHIVDVLEGACDGE